MDIISAWDRAGHKVDWVTLQKTLKDSKGNLKFITEHK